MPSVFCAAAPRTSALLLILVVGAFAAGCDTSGNPLDGAPSADGARSSVQTFASSTPSGALDLRFYAPALDPGEEVSVEVGAVRVRSTARRDGRHAVSWSAPERTVLRVLGVLRGETQAVVVPGAEPDGGTTESIPTSIHRYRVCQGGTCSEAIEYDYDLTAPSGDGTAQWTPPGEAPVTVDRLRFEIAASSRPSRSVTVTSPHALRLVSTQVPVDIEPLTSRD